MVINHPCAAKLATPIYVNITDDWIKSRECENHDTAGTSESGYLKPRDWRGKSSLAVVEKYGRIQLENINPQSCANECLGTSVIAGSDLADGCWCELPIALAGGMVAVTRIGAYYGKHKGGISSHFRIWRCLCQ